MRKLKSSNRELIIAILRKVELFESLSIEDIEELYTHNTAFYYINCHEVFVQEGEVEPFFYILLAGGADIFKNDEPNHVICQLSPGSIIGGDAYFERYTRYENVRANSESFLIKICVNKIRLLPNELKEKIKDKIILDLASRVIDMNDTQLDLVGTVRNAQRRLKTIENKMQKILKEYPHIRMRFDDKVC